MPRRAKAKIKWSELYSFSCFKPNPAAGGPAPVEQRLGQPGFSRVVFCNEPQKHRIKPYTYSDNYVSTTKYNLLTFLPKALFEQFRRVANLYFLLAAALSIASLAPVSKISLVAPLVIVVGISMIKEAVEDWHRFLQDLDVNSRTVKVHVGNGIFVEKAWKSLSVGDVVKVSKNEYFASDLVLLSSSFEDGLCYVETMNLDGETNLKVKRCLEATLNLSEDAKFSDLRATINCEDPNPNLYTFVGNLTFKSQTYPLCSSQVLLRGSKLRNTNYIYGVVIFTGPDTKVIRNSTTSPSKRSQIERRMDRIIYILFSMLLVISLISSTGSAVVTGSKKFKWWYVQLQEGNSFFNPSDLVFSGFLQFIRALILYGYLIPISLYVSIELVRVLQALFINRDVEMYDEKTNKTVQARTSNLNEELGQVEMILSDKTGTLTCNQMEFRKCSIAGISYGGDVNEVDLAASKRMNINTERYGFGLDGSDPTSQSFDMFEFSLADARTEKAILGAEQGVDNFGKEISRISSPGEGIVIKGFNFRDDRLTDKLWIGSSNVTDTIMFFRVMTLCHTGIPAEEDEAGKFKYEAESPEEVAFLIASQEFGFQFCGRTQSLMVVKELDPSSALEVEREYKLLHLLEFSSSRKRMSVIVSNEDGWIFLLCKGADNIIFDRLAENGRTHQQATSLHLSKYAEDGLRTMAFAYRIIDTAEYGKWNKIFTEAKATMGPQREELIENASEMIEKDLILAGAVAVEDKLQKGVPESIDKLAQAGLKIWLLTGDKKETAVNVGFACSLLRHGMRQIHLSSRKEAESHSSVEALKNDILDQIEKCYRETRDKSSTLALVIDGKALEIALRTDVKDEFLRLAVSCSSVICCRVSPKQKALITRLVKEFTGKTTLAIGDGANDVGMIQEADIGVGISGMEGMQAVMASDFSLPGFCFLERLLMVHGHWCYKRFAKMILYFMYKNIVFGLTLFYYEVYTSFSGDVLYDNWFMVMFNVLLTSLPVIALGVLEQDVPADVCLQFPALYQQGQKNIYFSWERIFGWLLNGAMSSLAIFTITIHALSPSAFEDLGQVADLSHMGAIAYTGVIWTVNCQIALILSHFTWIQHLLIWGSILCWYIFLFFYGALPPGYSGPAFHILTEAIGPAPMYWAVTLLVVVTSLLPYFIHIIIQRSFYPLDDHLIQEMKYCRKDITDNEMWLREQNNSKKTTRVGFSARVDAEIRHLREQLQHKKR